VTPITGRIGLMKKFEISGNMAWGYAAFNDLQWFASGVEGPAPPTGRLFSQLQEQGSLGWQPASGKHPGTLCVQWDDLC